MAIDTKRYGAKHGYFLKDTRSLSQRIASKMQEPFYITTTFILALYFIWYLPPAYYFTDAILFFCIGYTFWLHKKNPELPFKMPASSGMKDPNNTPPGGGKPKKAEGIMYFGNEKESGEELWLNNSDARTHILYLGTTGAGKTEGLKSIATNAMCWGSGFIYVDGKADTDLWSSLSSLARRFGRDDDLMVLNYMTGNKDGAAASNTINPFSSGSASYLTNLMVSLMPAAEGDNAMWKDRAVSLMGALMPVMTWMRDNLDMPLNVDTVRKNLDIKKIISLSRDDMLPARLRRALSEYLNTLPGFMEEAFDDDGNEKGGGPGSPPKDMSTTYQQHGYLTMQFTRSLQSLADDYGYIFETPSADIDINDVVLNRRILVVLIPALEKSADEVANLGKILAAMLKGMMGSTLGSDVEGDTSTVIENKPTRAPTPYITIFDEVGYYTTEGMAVMAAQARSLGFCLIYAAQDLPALEKRVKEEARSITANCNLKIFGKLEDPTQTKDFFEKTVGEALVAEVGQLSREESTFSGSYRDTSGSASLQTRAKASYSELRNFTEGQAVATFGDNVVEAKIFYANPSGVRSLRVHRMLALPPPDRDVHDSIRTVGRVLDNFQDKRWTARRAESLSQPAQDIAALAKGFALGRESNTDLASCGGFSVARVADILDLIPDDIEQDDIDRKEDGKTDQGGPDITTKSADKNKRPDKNKRIEPRLDEPVAKKTEPESDMADDLVADIPMDPDKLRRDLERKRRELGLSPRREDRKKSDKTDTGKETGKEAGEKEEGASAPEFTQEKEPVSWADLMAGDGEDDDDEGADEDRGKGSTPPKGEAETKSTTDKQSDDGDIPKASHVKAGDDDKEHESVDNRPKMPWEMADTGSGDKPDKKSDNDKKESAPAKQPPAKQPNVPDNPDIEPIDEEETNKKPATADENDPASMLNDLSDEERDKLLKALQQSDRNDDDEGG